MTLSLAVAEALAASGDVAVNSSRRVLPRAERFGLTLNFARVDPSGPRVPALRQAPPMTFALSFAFARQTRTSVASPSPVLRAVAVNVAFLPGLAVFRFGFAARARSGSPPGAGSIANAIEFASSTLPARSR